VRADLLEQGSSESSLTFQDVAVHQVAYDSMLFAQRRPLHRLAAEWIERTFHANLSAHYPLLAHHWRQAEEPEKAIEYLEKAGQHALQTGAYEEAERYFEQSLELEERSAVLSDGFYVQPAADWAAARQYALSLLERELSPDLTYHNLWHTCEDVLPAAQRLAALLGVGEDETRLLEIAAAYHDLGYTAQRHEHERLGAEIAERVLPGFGFSPAQVVAVQGMIMATQLPQSPHTLLEQILADADLDVLGREDFFGRNEDLRAELVSSGLNIDLERWYTTQLQILESHHYWTAAARSLRDAGKQRNILALRQRLAQTGGL
jgi:uncharacterized protein